MKKTDLKTVLITALLAAAYAVPGVLCLVLFGQGIVFPSLVDGLIGVLCLVGWFFAGTLQGKRKTRPTIAILGTCSVQLLSVLAMLAVSLWSYFGYTYAGAPIPEILKNATDGIALVGCGFVLKIVGWLVVLTATHFREFALCSVIIFGAFLLGYFKGYAEKLNSSVK